MKIRSLSIESHFLISSNVILEPRKNIKFLWPVMFNWMKSNLIFNQVIIVNFLLLVVSEIITQFDLTLQSKTLQAPSYALSSGPVRVSHWLNLKSAGKSKLHVQSEMKKLNGGKSRNITFRSEPVH